MDSGNAGHSDSLVALGSSCCSAITPRARHLWQAAGEISRIASFGTVEAAARALNWSILLLLPFMLRSSEEYGLVGLLVSVEMLVANVLRMGQDRAILRFYAREASRASFLSSILTIWGGLAWLPFSAILLLLAAGRQSLFGLPLIPHLILLAFSVAVLNLNAICVSIGRVQQNLVVFAWFRISYLASKFATVLAMAWLLGKSCSYSLGASIAALAMLVVMVPFLRRRAASRPDWQDVRRLAFFGAPLVVHVVSGNILAHFSRFFLQAYGTTKDVGVFTLAFALGSSLFFLYAALATFFEPKIYSLAHDPPRNERWLGYYANSCVAAAALCSTILLVIYPHVLARLPHDYQGAEAVIPFMIGAVLLQPLYLQGNYRLATYTRTSQIACATTLGGALNIVFSIWLVPTHGIWGAGLSLYLATLLQSLYALGMSLRAAGIRWCEHLLLPTMAVSLFGSASVLFVHRTPMALVSLPAICLCALSLLHRSYVRRGGGPT